MQISTHIFEHLKERLERYVRAHGVKRGFLIEQALDHDLRALEELPPDAIVPASIVLLRKSAEHVRDLLERPPEPTEAMEFYRAYGFMDVEVVKGAGATHPAPVPMFLALGSVPRRG